MRFTAKRQALLEAFQVVGTIIPSRPIRAILSHVHLVVDDASRARLEATDLELSIRFDVPLERVDAVGEAVLPASRVASILRECTTDTVDFSSDELGKVRIEAGRAAFNLLSESPEEFPHLPEFPSDRAFGLDRQKLVTLIRKTQFAVAREKSRFAFNGAKLLIEGDVARMVATDGKRLAMKEVGIDGSDAVSAGPIVPARALAVFEKVMTDEDDTVRMALDDKEIMLHTTRAVISSRLVEGSFPNYQAVIPKETPIRVRFSREELASAFRQAALLTSHETRSVRFELAEGVARLSAHALDAGDARIEVDAPDFEGEAFAIAFNPDYVIEGLKVFDADEVELGFSRPNAPAVVRGEEGLIYVIMPVTMRNG
ncbi:MAG: DNA polymerase III subunit beta [Planctomycetota bacterium]